MVQQLERLPVHPRSGLKVEDEIGCILFLRGTTFVVLWRPMATYSDLLPGADQETANLLMTS